MWDRDDHPAITDLPPEFLASLEALAAAYLRETDPIKQSGFSGGSVRWRAEREPILEAVDRDGSILDVGCANGLLLECLVGWAAERSIELQPHGLEQSEGLAALARRRLGESGTIHVGNAWAFDPPRRYDFVYTMNDIVPEPFLTRYLRRLARLFLLPGGRLIVGAYGSRSRGLAAADVESALIQAELPVVGTARGGDPPLTMFAWTEGVPAEGPT